MAWTIGRAFGIPVRLHFTMLLLPILTADWVSMDGVPGVASWLGLVVLLFGSVLLHELGHALTARRFGIHTHDIVLTPIGGMARVVTMPRNPRHEIAIAVAGPLVSLALSGIAFALQILLSLLPFIPESVYIALFVLCGANLMLGIFNLVPALPMDGGRVLRGLLALKRDYLTATRIAARVGRVLAIVGGFFALWEGRWTLGLIAVFIYIIAGTEVRMAELRAYQERMRSNPLHPGGPRPGGNVWTWTWSTGRDYPFEATRGREPDVYDVDAEWAKQRTESNKDAIVVGGKAEVISRKDPKSKT